VPPARGGQQRPTRSVFGGQKINDAVLALVALDFQARGGARRRAGGPGGPGPEATVEALVRAALRKGA